MQTIKDFLSKLKKETIRLLIIIISITVIGVVAAVVALQAVERSNYSTLFTDLNAEDVQAIASILSESDVSYQYSERTGTIRVPAAEEDAVRAQLVSEGYPQSGFTYDMYINNAGLMSTESDRKQYTLYGLQDRLGATICLFDGVKDAKVTIALEEEQVYALSNSANVEASASAVITMKTGQTLTADKASAVKNLIANSVKGVTFSNVKVFDAATMTEIGNDDATGTGGSTTTLEFTSLVENNIATNIRRVLEQLYGEGKVAISVKGTLNMDRLIQENITYSVPDQVDEEDRSGLLYSETIAGEGSGEGSQYASGVVGSDSNADTPRYTNENGEEPDADSYYSGSATREWLYNTLTEQREVQPGVLENVTVGIVINTADNQVSTADLKELVANAAGIPKDDIDDKITIIRSLVESDEENIPASSNTPIEVRNEIPLAVIIALISCAAMNLVLLLLLLIRKSKKKRIAMEEEDFVAADPFDMEAAANEGTFPSAEKARAVQLMEEEDSEMDQNEEIINLRMQRNLKLKQNIGEFVDQNPQVAAKLLQGWLRGEGGDNGGKRVQQPSAGK